MSSNPGFMASKGWFDKFKARHCNYFYNFWVNHILTKDNIYEVNYATLTIWIINVLKFKLN